MFFSICDFSRVENFKREKLGITVDGFSALLNIVGSVQTDLRSCAHLRRDAAHGPNFNNSLHVPFVFVKSESANLQRMDVSSDDAIMGDSPYEKLPPVSVVSLNSLKTAVIIPVKSSSRND